MNSKRRLQVGAAGFRRLPQPQPDLNRAPVEAGGAKPSRFPHRGSPRSGMALIVTVLFLAALTLLVCALAISTRVGLQTARNHSDMLRARQLADGAIDYTLAMLANAMPPSSITQTWVSGPGVAWRRDPSGVWTQLLLYSTATPIPGFGNGYLVANNGAISPALTSQGLNMNERLYITGQNTDYQNWIITNGYSYVGVTNSNEPPTYWQTNIYSQSFGAPLLAGWVNLSTDGKPSGYYSTNVVTSGVSTLNTGMFCYANYSTYTNGEIHPLIARWAVWVDADACKINLRAAGLRFTNDLNQSRITNIDVRALSAPFATATAAQIQSLRNLSTVEELRLSNSWSDAGGYTSNKFALTIHGTDTNVDAFGRARVDLNGLTRDITGDVGVGGFVGAGAANYALAYERLTNTLWATRIYAGIVTSNQSLRAKYGEFGVRQILANIVDYQTQTNSTTAGILNFPFGNRDADVAAANPAWTTALDQDPWGIPQYFSGLRKGPMIDAVIVHVATNKVVNGSGGSARTNCEVRVFVDVKLVNGYDFPGGANWILAIGGATAIIYNTNSTTLVKTQTWASASNPTTFLIQNDIGAHSYGLWGADPGAPTDINPSADIWSMAYKVTITNLNTYSKLTPPVVTNVTVKLNRVLLYQATAGGEAQNVVDWMGELDFSNATTAVGTTNRLVFNKTTAALGNIVPFINGSSPAFSSDGTPTANFKPIALVKQDPRVRTFVGWTSNADTNFANNGPNLTTNWWVYPGTYPDGATIKTNSVVTDGNDFGYDSRIAPTVYRLLADTRSVTNAADTSPSHKFYFDDIAETKLQSVGELSFIHTGYPWRSIRLRSVIPNATNTTSSTPETDKQLAAPYRGVGDPNTGLTGVESNSLPDWVMLDCFSATNAATLPGRININSKIYGETVTLPNYVSSSSGSDGQGFSVATSNSLPSRLPPLRALLANTSGSLTPASSQLTAIATNIVNRIFVPGSPYAATNQPAAYRTPGEICEVSGLDYFGDAAPPNKNQRQQALRRISELITTRSDVFTIWTVAQIIQERNTSTTEPDGHFDWVWFHPLGTIGAAYGWVDGDGDNDNGDVNHFSKDAILAQIRVQTVVQRYVDGSGNVCFRTLYTRYWND